MRAALWLLAVVLVVATAPVVGGEAAAAAGSGEHEKGEGEELKALAHRPAMAFRGSLRPAAPGLVRFDSTPVVMALGMLFGLYHMANGHWDMRPLETILLAYYLANLLPNMSLNYRPSSMF